MGGYTIESDIVDNFIILILTQKCIVPKYKSRSRRVSIYPVVRAN